MKISIKNMVCNRCISAVQNLFDEHSILISHISLGEVETEYEIGSNQLKNITNQLQLLGFERIEDSTKKKIEKIKTLIIQKISEEDIAEDFVLSEFLSNNLNQDYSAISKLFSQNENFTLEHYFIIQKIEKVKELLVYGELSLTEISGKLGYKSVQHLSSQFKNITGYTPSDFKKQKNKLRKPLDEV